MWREDISGSEKELPTFTTAVITSSDFVRKQDIYTLSIRHVRSFYGKGFMANISYGNDTKQNSVVFLGIGREVYTKALTEGENMLKSAIEELVMS